MTTSAATATATHPLTPPCRCGCHDGYLRPRGPHVGLYCNACGKHQRWVKRTEAGLEQRSTASLHDFSPSHRARILERDGGRCQLCGREAPEVLLTIGHILSVRDGLELGATDSEINSDENLCAMCEECNSGQGPVTVPPRLYLHILRARLAQERWEATHGKERRR